MTTNVVKVPVACGQRPCGKCARKIVRLKMVHGATPMMLCSDHTIELLQRAATVLEPFDINLEDVIQVDHLNDRIVL